MLSNNSYCEFYIHKAYGSCYCLHRNMYKVYIIYWTSVGSLLLINAPILEYGANDETIGVSLGLQTHYLAKKT